MTSESFGAFHLPPMSPASCGYEEFNLPSPDPTPLPASSGSLQHDVLMGSSVPPPSPPPAAPTASVSTSSVHFPASHTVGAGTLRSQEPMQHSQASLSCPQMPLTLPYPPMYTSDRSQPAFHTSCFRLMPSYAQQPPVLSWVSHTQPSAMQGVNPFYHGQMQRALPPYPGCPYPQHQNVMPTGPGYPCFPQGIYAGVRRRGAVEFSAGVYGDLHGNWPMARVHQPRMPLVMTQHPNPTHMGRGMLMFPPTQQHLRNYNLQQRSPHPSLHDFSPTDHHSAAFQRSQFHPPSHPPPMPHQVTPSPQHSFIDLTLDVNKGTAERTDRRGECSYNPPSSIGWPSPPMHSESGPEDTPQRVQRLGFFPTYNHGQSQGQNYATSSSLPQETPKRTVVVQSSVSSDCGIIRPKPLYASPRQVTPGHMPVAALPTALPSVSLPTSWCFSPRPAAVSVSPAKVSLSKNLFPSPPPTMSIASTTAAPQPSVSISPVLSKDVTLPSVSVTAATSSASPNAASRNESTSPPTVVKRKPQKAKGAGRKPRSKPTTRRSTTPRAGARATDPAPTLILPVPEKEIFIPEEAEFGEQVVEIETSISVDANIYKEFANSFEACRIKLGYSYEHVVQQVRLRYGLAISVADLQSLEELTLPIETCSHLVDILHRWIEDTAKAAGATDEDLHTTMKLSTTTTSIYPQRVRKYLEMAFGRKKNPTQAEMQNMAQFLGVEKDFIRKWFSNRRKEDKCLGKRPMGKHRISRKKTALPNAVTQAGQAIPSSHYSITVEVPSIHPRDTGSLFDTDYVIDS